MSQDSYNPTEYAELMASMAATLGNDLADGNLGRAGDAQREMVEQLCAGGIREWAAERLVGDYIHQLRQIDEAAEVLIRKMSGLRDVTDEMMGNVRNLHPGFNFDRYAV